MTPHILGISPHHVFGWPGFIGFIGVKLTPKRGNQGKSKIPESVLNTRSGKKGDEMNP